MLLKRAPGLMAIGIADIDVAILGAAPDVVHVAPAPPAPPATPTRISVLAILFPTVPTHRNGAFLREMGTPGWRDVDRAKRGAGVIHQNVGNPVVGGRLTAGRDIRPGSQFGDFTHEFG